MENEENLHFYHNCIFFHFLWFRILTTKCHTKSSGFYLIVLFPKEKVQIVKLFISKIGAILPKLLYQLLSFLPPFLSSEINNLLWKTETLKILYYVHIWEYSHAHLETGKPNVDKLNLYNLRLWVITEIKFSFRMT